MQNKPRATKKYFFTALMALGLFCSLPLFAESINLLYSQAFAIADLSALDISLDYEELHISQIYGDEISIEIESNNINRLPQVQVEEGVLTIKAAKARQTTKALRMEKGNVCRVRFVRPLIFLLQAETLALSWTLLLQIIARQLLPAVQFFLVCRVTQTFL